MQLDGQKPPSLSPLFPLFISPMIFQHLLITPLFSLFISSQPSWLYPCMPPNRERWERKAKRETGGNNKCNTFNSFPPLSFLSFALSLCPPEGSNFTESENTKMTFWSWPSSAVAEQGKKAKHYEDRERTASGPPVTFLKISVWIIDFPFCCVFVCRPLCVMIVCVSLTLHLSCRQSHFILVYLIGCLSSPSVSRTSHRICFHAENHLPTSPTPTVLMNMNFS